MLFRGTISRTSRATAASNRKAQCYKTLLRPSLAQIGLQIQLDVYGRCFL